MNLPQLMDSLEFGENQHLEFKGEKPDLSTIGRTVCAFLNSGGGAVICGIDEMRGMPGVADPEETREQLVKLLERHLSPKALVSVGVEEHGGIPFLIINVPVGADIPYAFRNTVYLRNGERSTKAHIEDVREMVLKKSAEPERWERRLSLMASDSDADREEIGKAVLEIGRAPAFPFRDSNDSTMFLEDLSLARFGRLTQGGAILFGKNVAHHFPQVRVRAALFDRDQSDATYRDLSSYEGLLSPALTHLFHFVVRNTPAVSRFASGDLQRRDEPVYPLEAVREGLVNAFAHRDYADSSGGIAVFIFPDRLEIWNSGALPPGITPEGLKEHGNHSVLRNPDIAHVLYLRGYMERLGRGSLLITRACRDAGLPDPVWKSDEHLGVTLTIMAPLDAANRKPDYQPIAAPEATPQAAPEATPQVRSEILPEKKLVLIIEGELTRVQLKRLLGLKDDKHFREHYLQPAIRQRLIEMTIPGRPNSGHQRYRLTRKGQRIKNDSLGVDPKAPLKTDESNP